MTFEEVIGELFQARPNATVGKTAQRGKYHDQAIHMAFHRVDNLNYYAEGPRGKGMWLYFNEKLDRICCGNKD
jgi:hypothetical protein